MGKSFKTKKQKKKKSIKQKYIGAGSLNNNLVNGDTFKIIGFEYLPISDAIITAGRNCKIKNSYGLRPKMIINFSMPFEIYEDEKNIHMKTIAVDKNGKENSFSTTKYNLKNVLENYYTHPGGSFKFEKEKKSWLNLNLNTSLNAATYRYLSPDINIKGNAIFQIDFYPCRFLLKGNDVTHKKLFVEISPDYPEDYHGDKSKDTIIGMDWNTYDVYNNPLSKKELCSRLDLIPYDVHLITGIPIDEIKLDPSAESTKKNCQN